MAVIEVFADVYCPFAHVGLRRWFERRAELGRDDIHLHVRAWPLELINGEPLTGEHEISKVAALREHAAPDLFCGFRPDSFPASTIPALQLTHAAYEVSLETGEAMAAAVRDALFEEGLDVGDSGVLRDLASRHGLDPDIADRDGLDVVTADWDAGRARGVIGSPHFFGDGWDLFCPSLSITREEGCLHVERAVSRFEELAEASFGT
ncbi:MAG: DsbA family protein [Microthrixaceae bacterium]|nr:DsbA family protein [Microthrixaceae bacterium]